MKTQKRNTQQRAFKHGYKAAIFGKSISSCPHEAQGMRHQWTSGWREGRQDHWDGNTAIAGLHKQ